MKMYSLHNFVILALLCVVSVKSDEVCSVLEHRGMQTDFTNCSRRYTEEHFNIENGDTCHLVKSVVGKCGELWERCHTSREVRRMRDLHIEALVRQYEGEGGLEDCDLVQEYRQSGRSPDDTKEDLICSDTQTLDIQTKFQTCSHSTATSVYQTIQDLTSVKIISDKLCKTLTTIGTVCVKNLNECFAQDDVRQMRKSHLEEMKTFLLRISQEKVTGSALDNCKVMEYVENEITNQAKRDEGLADIFKNSDEDEKEEYLYSKNIEPEVESITEKKSAQEEADNIENQGGIFDPGHISNNDKDIPEVTTSEFKSTDSVIPEVGITIALTDVLSTSSIEPEENVTAENNRRDDAVTNPSSIDDADEYSKHNEDTTEAGDKAGTGRVSKQKMVMPEEGAAGGGGKPKAEVLTMCVAVITSLFILVGTV